MADQAKNESACALIGLTVDAISDALCEIKRKPVGTEEVAINLNFAGIYLFALQGKLDSIAAILADCMRDGASLQDVQTRILDVLYVADEEVAP